MAAARDVATFGVRFLQDEAAFKRTVTHPVLVWDAPPMTKESPLLFATRPGEAAHRPVPGKPVFFDVKKSAKNAFADEVTVGRTANNDVSLQDNSVSRFHAYFAPSQKGWSLVDAKSTSGTWVNRKRLQVRVPQALGDQAVVRFGEVELQFLPPTAFWAYLRRLIGQK